MEVLTLKSIKKAVQDVVINAVEQSEEKIVTMFARALKDFEQRLTNKIELVDTKLSNRIDEFEKKTIFKFDGVNRRLDDLATTRVKYEDHQSLTERVEKLEEKVFRKK